MINGASKIQARIRIPGRIGEENAWYDAHIVKTDPDTDIALIKLDGENFPTMPLGTPDVATAGDRVLLLGYPFGYVLSDEMDRLAPSVIEGRIASIQVSQGHECIFADLQSKHGNSGGPVVEEQTGLVVGVLCGSIAEKYSCEVDKIDYICPMKYIWKSFFEE